MYSLFKLNPKNDSKLLSYGTETAFLSSVATGGRDGIRLTLEKLGSIIFAGRGGGHLGPFLLGMCRWPLRAPTPL